jgi:hypothetical protein
MGKHLKIESKILEIKIKKVYLKNENTLSLCLKITKLNARYLVLLVFIDFP